MKTENKINIDILLFAFLCLLTITLLDHTVNCINFLLFNNNVSEKKCFIIIFTIFAMILLFLYKYKIINLYKQHFDKLDIVFLGIFLIFYLHKLPFPDTSADTMNYEVYIGKFAFTKKIIDMKPYLPFYGLWFSLSNRIFYYFLCFFGYRLSTIINFLVICVSYYKVKELALFFINYIDAEKYKRFNMHSSTLIVCCVAFAALYKEYIILGSTIIKGDLFVLPLFLECILLIFNIKSNKKTYAYAGLLIGLSIALKLTNLAYFIPIVIFLLIKERRNITIRNILIAASFCIIPILPYLIYNLVISGNPVFPFYNKLFRSPYYPIVNFKDSRWGPKTVIETIFWPVVLLFSPQRTSEIGFNSHSLTIGYLGTLTSFIFLKKVPLLKKIIPIYICLFCSILLWSITVGYGRYMISLEVLSIILMVVFIYAIYCNYFDRGIYLLFSYCLIIIMSLGVCTNNLTLFSYEWSWRPSIFTNQPLYMDAAKNNIKYILNDRTVTDNPIVKYKLDSVKTWVCIGGASAYPTLSNPSADFFYLDKNYANTEIDRFNFTRNFFESRQKDGIYTLTHQIDERFINLINLFGFIIVDYERFYLNFADANNQAWFLSLMLKDYAEMDGIKGLSLDDIK